MWANVRQRTVVEVTRDPNERYVLGIGNRILRTVQGVGLRSVVGFDGDPDQTYGGSYAGPVQPNITGAAAGIASPTAFRDMSGSDLASAPTTSNVSASKVFGERLRRGRMT